MTDQRFIIHIDMDAFFASVEQRDNPYLRGKPVIVGADPKKGKGRGVVSTCSYEARKFGVHSAMPISVAYARCPQAVFLPVDMDKYSLVSSQIYKIFYDFTPDIEPVSCDEAFLDITRSYSIFDTPRNTALELKARIKKETGLTASVGLAPTKMAAKIASDLKKPDGFVEVGKDGVRDFLRPLDAGRIWGLGKKAKQALENMGIKTIGDLADSDVNGLIRLFGRNGLSYWNLANGIDESEVVTDGEAKSVSNEHTFGSDTLDKEKIKSCIAGLSQKIAVRLRREGIKARTISIKVRLQGFDTHTRSSTLGMSTNFPEVICHIAKKLFSEFDSGNKKIRLIGVKASNLSSADIKESLFADPHEEKLEQVHKALDKIMDKFGDDSISIAGGLTKQP